MKIKIDDAITSLATVTTLLFWLSSALTRTTAKWLSCGVGTVGAN